MSSTNPNSKDNFHTATTTPDDDDYTSSSGSSSSETESELDESEDENEKTHADHTTTTAPATTSSPSSSIPTVPGRPRPQIHHIDRDSPLLSRLSAFLPKMKDANENLEREIAAGRGKDMVLDEVDEQDGKDYIEMNLGLGVLEEKRGDNEVSSNDHESDREGADGGSGFGAGSSNKEPTEKGDSNVLDKLMGGKQSDADKPSIEEMAE